MGNEKNSVNKLQELREQVEQVKKEIQIAQSKYDLEKMAELQYGRLPQLQKQLESEEANVKNKDLSLVRESVTDEEIASVEITQPQKAQSSILRAQMKSLRDEEEEEEAKEKEENQ